MSYGEFLEGDLFLVHIESAGRYVWFRVDEMVDKNVRGKIPDKILLSYCDISDYHGVTSFRHECSYRVPTMNEFLRKLKWVMIEYHCKEPILQVDEGLFTL